MYTIFCEMKWSFIEEFFSRVFILSTGSHCHSQNQRYAKLNKYFLNKFKCKLLWQLINFLWHLFSRINFNVNSCQNFQFPLSKLLSWDHPTKIYLWTSCQVHSDIHSSPMRWHMHHLLIQTILIDCRSAGSSNLHPNSSGWSQFKAWDMGSGSCAL